jgi:hypothetical protein
VVGGRCSLDPTWRVEEVADDGDSWGKTTTWSSGLARRKESGNGAVEWQLGGGKPRWRLTSALGENAGKGGGSFGREAFL